MTDQPPLHAVPGMLHRRHPTSVAFFDETGAIASDRFFSVGLLRVEDHPTLLSQVKALRKKHKFWEEFKWTGITAANKEYYKELFDLLLASPALFSCFVADRHVADPVSRFGDTFKAYEKLATQLLLGSIRPYEVVSVIADMYSAPNDRSFERSVRTECNNRLQRMAVASVVQVDSHATPGLQLVDVLTGAVGFAYRASVGGAQPHSHKGEVAEYVAQALGVQSLTEVGTLAGFSVKNYEHTRWLKKETLKVNEKEGRSSTRRGRRGGRGRHRKG